MSHVLIVDDDDALRDTLARAAQKWGFEASVANSTEAALSVLRSRHVDVLVTDLRMDGPDGIDLIRNAVDASPKTQTVLMSAYATAREQQLATGYGTVRVLCKPFTPEDLRKAIGEALDSRKGYRGTVHGLSLIDMLQMFHLSRRTVALVIGGMHPGEVHFRDGRLVHATCGELSGREAFKALLSGDSGSIATTAAIDVPTTITSTFDALLMDTLRELDEGERHVVSLAPCGLDFDSAFTSKPPGPISSPSQDASKIAHASASQTLEQLCKKITEQVEGALACGVVDIHSGMLLGIAAADASSAFQESLAEACTELFAGTNMARLHQAVRLDPIREGDSTNYPEEIYLTSRHNLYFMKGIKASRTVVVLITTTQCSLGMGWASLRSHTPAMERLVP